MCCVCVSFYPPTYPSMNNSCEGRGVLREGTATQDRVCVTVTTTTRNAQVITPGVSSSLDTSHTTELRIPHSSFTATDDIIKVEDLHTTLNDATSVVSNITPESSKSTGHSSNAPSASLTTHPGLASSAIITSLTTNRRVTHRTTRTPTSRYLTEGNK